MQRSWRNVEHIASRDRNLCKEWRNVATRLKRVLKLVGTHRWVASKEEVCAWSRVEDHPRLALSNRSCAMQLGGECVSRMHLYGEAIGNVKQLHQWLVLRTDLAEPSLANWRSGGVY
jgi:hypothetical protein